MNKISINFKDGTKMELQADEIEVTSEQIILKEKTNKFRTIIFLNKIITYKIS